MLKVYEWNIPSNRILSYTFLILFVYSKGSIGVLWRLGRLFGISRRLSIHLVDFGKPFSILRRSRRLIGILLQYTLTNLVDCSIFLGDPWVTLWYTRDTPYTHSYTFCILGRLRILIRILKNFISGYSPATKRFLRIRPITYVARSFGDSFVLVILIILLGIYIRGENETSERAVSHA